LATDGWRRTRRGEFYLGHTGIARRFFSFPLEQQMCILLLLVLPWDLRLQDRSRFVPIDYGCLVGQLDLAAVELIEGKL
jgi:hypothetical protein